MSVSRHRTHRKDETQDDIIKALRFAGVEVAVIGEPCDLLCYRAGDYWLLDCDGVTQHRKRSETQLAKFQRFGVRLVKTPEDALRAVELI